MLRKGKRWLAMGIAAMIACMVPMGTIKASEEGESVSQNSISAGEKYEQPMEILAQNESAWITIKITLSDDGTNDIAVRSTDNSVGSDRKVYNNHDQAFVITVEGSTALTYYLDTDGAATAKSEEQLDGLCKQSVPADGRIRLSNDGKYVLYVKAVAGEEAAYAGSKCRVVVDTQKPKIEGLTDQGRYPVGQTFTVSDDNDVTVTINEQSVSPDSAGQYTIQAQQYANNYVIKAKDIAGNWSDTVTVYLTDTTSEPEEPDGNTITKPGTYSLQSDTKYTLGAGSWKVAGDSSVYPGGIVFYVPSGEYTFQKQ